jgi:PadR family transcriptional regulator AphA
MPSYFEPTVGQSFDPLAIFTACVESGAPSLLLDTDKLPEEFFDLSTGLAGELLHKLTTYRMRLAGVVPDVGAHSKRFQEFAYEANKGHHYRFFPDRQSAIEWLEAE